MEHAEILDLFTYCHRHNEELVPGIPENIKNYFNQLSKKRYYNKDAYRRLGAKFFPYAAYGEPVSGPQKPEKTWHCPVCCKEVQAYMEKAHHKKILLADHEKYVCDIAEDIREHYEKYEVAGEVIGWTGELGTYYIENRITERPNHPVLADLVNKMDDVARTLLNSADTLLEIDYYIEDRTKDESEMDPMEAYLKDRKRDESAEDRVFDQIRRFLEIPGEKADINELRGLFEIQVDTGKDLKILNQCQWLYFALSEMQIELSGERISYGDSFNKIDLL